MKSMQMLLGACVMLAGAVFALQGFNVLPGSFMTGRPEWAVIGTVGFVVGLLVVLAAWRMGSE